MSFHSDLCPDNQNTSPSMDMVTIEVPPPDYEDVVPSRREKCVSCCKKFTAFLFSTVGLTSMLIGYTIFGGFIFMKLEAPHENKQRTYIKESRQWHVKQMWNITIEMNIFYEPNWTIAIEDLLQNYTDKIYQATKKQGWDGQDNDDQEADPQWSFAGAMLYSITVITTIGYGHIAPRTMWGRIVTILYAIFGIPLCLLTITNLGGFMATAFRFIYNNICCGLCCLCCEKQKAQVRSSTRKYKDPNKADPDAAESLTGGSRSPSTPEHGPKSFKSNKPKKVSMTVTWRSGLRRVLKTEDNKSVSVPIYVSLLLIASYILSGAVLFTLWEDDWDYLIGSYFCFITLTTIGFGDYVPGTGKESWNNQQKLVLCAMYLIVGLSLIAMCFDLMQEEARNKVRYIAAKLGLVDKEKKDGDTNLDNAPKATQTTSPANAKPPKSSSSSSSFKSLSLSKSKSKSKNSLDANNTDHSPTKPEATIKESKKRKKEKGKDKEKNNKKDKNKNNASDKTNDKSIDHKSIDHRDHWYDSDFMPETRILPRIDERNSGNSLMVPAETHIS